MVTAHQLSDGNIVVESDEGPRFVLYTHAQAVALVDALAKIGLIRVDGKIVRPL